MTQDESQEPVAWIEKDMHCDDLDPDSVTCEKPTISADGWEWVPLYTTSPQRTEQEPVAWAKFLHYPECWDTAAYPTLHDAIHEALAWSGCSVCTPPQRTEQNFCSRCGKRTKDLTTIHTCTPPQD